MSLSGLLTRRFRRQAATPLAGRSERRDAVRYEISLPVSLRRDGMPPFAGSLINISISGAAITLHGWNVPVPAPWPTRLKHGDEIALTGLLDVPLGAWVVAREEAVLRVRFLIDETVRERLAALMERVSALSAAAGRRG